jgi:methylmalonyl-CoA/ethylmalonyl-CoA epimerase
MTLSDLEARKGFFERLDHVAIAVKDTEAALRVYRDVLRLPLLFSEVLHDQNVRLTHLDMGACHLQLVEPMVTDHPLQTYLGERGESLHHVCFLVDDVQEAIAELPARCGLSSRDPWPRSGPCGRRSIFVDPAGTRGVLFELTSEGPARPAARI